MEASTVESWIRDHRIYVAEVDDDIVGGVRLGETDPGRVTLSRLGVHESWKGEGIGSMLPSHAEETARDQGADTIWLSTPQEHPYLADFYRDRGYEKTDEYPLEYRDYDEVVMEKDLDG